MKTSKILITGGAGFIGSHLTNKMVKDGHRVIIIDNLSHGKKENLSKKARFIKIDIRSRNFPNILEDIRPDFIFHLAAQSSVAKSFKTPKSDLRINFIPILDILKVAKKTNIQKIIFASSAAVYGSVQKIPITENASKSPISPYGIAKLASENFIEYYFKNYRLPYTILRYANVYGPDQDTSAEGGVVAIFINKALYNQNADIFGDGNQTRDFIYVSDVVSANIKALNNKVIGDFNIGSGRQTSINNLFGKIIKISNSRINKIYKPLPNWQVKNSSFSYKKFNKITGWKPKLKLEEGLRITLNYYKLPRVKNPRY